MNTPTALSITEANFEQSSDRVFIKHSSAIDASRIAPCKPCGVASWWSGQGTTDGAAVDPYIVTFWQIVDENTEDGYCVREKMEKLLSQMQFEEFIQYTHTLRELRTLACAEGREEDLRRAWRHFRSVYCPSLDFPGFLTSLIFLGEATFRTILQNPSTSFPGEQQTIIVKAVAEIMDSR